MFIASLNLALFYCCGAGIIGAEDWPAAGFCPELPPVVIVGKFWTMLMLLAETVPLEDVP